MAEEVDNFLEHYGVKGMRWGKRGASTIAEAAGLTSGKAPLNRRGELKKPSYAREALIGSWSNSKKRYTNPQALRNRTNAGKLAAVATVASLGGTALSMIGSQKNSSAAAMVGAMLGSGASLVGTAALVSGVVAVRQERVARAQNG